MDYETLMKQEESNLPLKVVDIKQNDKDQGALIIYTSGTTGSPKAVVYTYSNLLNQIACLCKAWEWTEKDHILHCLPLHHVHGIINALCCPLYSAATVQFVKFHSDIVWNKLTNLDPHQKEIAKEVNVFMAVPTIYVKMIHFYDDLSKETQQLYSNEIKRMRLMVSGSAALPSPVFTKWKNITSHPLLERYGMSEIGMALSNLYKPEESR